LAVETKTNSEVVSLSLRVLPRGSVSHTASSLHDQHKLHRIRCTLSSSIYVTEPTFAQLPHPQNTHDSILRAVEDR